MANGRSGLRRHRLFGRAGGLRQFFGAVTRRVSFQRDDFDGATGFFDFFASGGADGVDLEGELFGDLAGAEDLDAIPCTVDEADLAQDRFIDDIGNGEFFEIDEVDRSVGNLEGGVVKAALGNAADEGHLTALEAKANAAAGAGFLTFVALAAGFAMAGALTATETFDAMAGAGTGLGIMKSDRGGHSDLVG